MRWEMLVSVVAWVFGVGGVLLVMVMDWPSWTFGPALVIMLLAYVTLSLFGNRPEEP